MLTKLSLSQFRNHQKADFDLNHQATLIVGPNAVGKTNVLEAVYLLATGQSFRAETEKEVIREGQEVSRLVGQIDDTELEIIWDGRGRFQKLYKVNGVGKRQVDFVGHVFAVLFSPLDLEIVVNGPSVRRKYLDNVLSQVHKDYRVAVHVYDRALRQRNRLLKAVRDQKLGPREIAGQLEFWNELLVGNGKIIHERRKDYLKFLSDVKSSVFNIQVHYDHSIVSPERLAKYAFEEIGAAVTLVGPHRDDFRVKDDNNRDLHSFGSRGEQRLAVFAMKLGELSYIQQKTGREPLLLLDDIFSELDFENRHHVLSVIPKQQTIMTTTDVELVDKKVLKNVEVIKFE